MLYKAKDFITALQFCMEILDRLEEREDYYTLGKLSAISGVTQEEYNEVIRALKVPDHQG